MADMKLSIVYFTIPDTLLAQATTPPVSRVPSQTIPTAGITLAGHHARQQRLPPDNTVNSRRFSHDLFLSLMMVRYCCIPPICPDKSSRNFTDKVTLNRITASMPTMTSIQGSAFL